MKLNQLGNAKEIFIIEKFSPLSQKWLDKDYEAFFENAEKAISEAFYTGVKIAVQKPGEATAANIYRRVNNIVELDRRDNQETLDKLYTFNSHLKIAPTKTAPPSRTDNAVKRETSILTYYELLEQKDKLGNDRRMILDVLERLDFAVTTREITEIINRKLLTKYPNLTPEQLDRSVKEDRKATDGMLAPSDISGRVTELRDDQLIAEDGKRNCLVTGRLANVHIVKYQVKHLKEGRE